MGWLRHRPAIVTASPSQVALGFAAILYRRVWSTSTRKYHPKPTVSLLRATVQPRASDCSPAPPSRRACDQLNQCGLSNTAITTTTNKTPPIHHHHHINQSLSKSRPMGRARIRALPAGLRSAPNGVGVLDVHEEDAPIYAAYSWHPGPCFTGHCLRDGERCDA